MEGRLRSKGMWDPRGGNALGLTGCPGPGLSQEGWEGFRVGDQPAGVPGRVSQASPSGASVQPESRPRHTPDSLPLQRSGNLPRASSAPGEVSQPL